MSRILIYTSPARGHLFPVVPIADELAARGHVVAVRTLGSEVGWLRDRGFDAAPADPRIGAIELSDHLGRSPMDRLKRSVGDLSRRAALELDDLREAIAEVEPEAVLVDINAWGASAVAEASGLPWATWCPYPLPVPSVDAPPFGPGFAPAKGWAGRLRDAIARPLVFGSLQRILLPPMNELRASLGLAPHRDVRSMQAAPPLTLYLTAEPFEYPRRDWPANIRMVGPMAWDPPADTPAWLDTIARPIVLVTTSSEFQADGRLAEVAMAALAGEDLDVVVTLPSVELDVAVPANAHVERFVPHGRVLERAVCAVTHGGMGATQKALSHGVPVCAVPFGRDQFEVARRVEQAEAGTRLPSARLSPDRLRAAVHAAIDRRAGAERIAEAFRRAGGAPVAADHLEAAFEREPVG